MSDHQIEKFCGLSKAEWDKLSFTEQVCLEEDLRALALLERFATGNTMREEAQTGKDTSGYGDSRQDSDAKVSTTTDQDRSGFVDSVAETDTQTVQQRLAALLARRDD